MKRGLSVELPNQYETFSGDILQPIDITALHGETAVKNPTR